MANLEKLAMDHAYWADKYRRLREEGQREAGLCERVDTVSAANCIEHVYALWREEWDPSGAPFYDEIADEVGMCQHCIRVRQLKKARGIAGRRLGNIRSAITKVGRRLSSNNEGTKP